MAGELSKVDLLFIVLLGCHLRLLPWLWLEELMEGWENDWDHWESVSFQRLWSSGKSHTRSCSVFRAIFCPVIEERIMDIRWPLCRYALLRTWLTYVSEKLASLSESCLLLTGIIGGWLLKLTPIWDRVDGALLVYGLKMKDHDATPDIIFQPWNLDQI